MKEGSTRMTIRPGERTSDTYRFFDHEFSVRSESEEFSSAFREIFGRFHLDGGKGKGAAYRVLRGKGPDEGFEVTSDGRSYAVEEGGDLPGFAYMKITDSALSKVRSHYLFHAAALSSSDRGVILPAASKSGKTTLTLELVKRGFKFLSDDVSAVSKSDHKLYPFPKRLGLLPQTLELCPEAELDSLKMLPMIGCGQKKLLDIEDLYPGSTGGPCELKYLVFLGPVMGTRREGEEDLYIVVSGVTDSLISDIREIDGVMDAAILPHRKYPIIKIITDGKRHVHSRIEEVCAGNGVLLFDASDGNEERPDFTATPELKKIPKSAAAVELLKRIKGVTSAKLESRGSMTGLFMEMGKVLSGVECFYLTPGSLEERAERLCELLGHK